MVSKEVELGGMLEKTIGASKKKLAFFTKEYGKVYNICIVHFDRVDVILKETQHCTA